MKAVTDLALATLKEVLDKAQAGQYAVGNFDVSDSDMLLGVMRAAEEAKSPVIIAYSGIFMPTCPVKLFSSMVHALAEDTDLPVALIWDHANNQEEIDLAVANGFTAVMMDASHLPFEENIRETRIVVEKCRKKGISVESELGHVGFEDAAFDPAVYQYTQPEQAAEFVERTGIDALAVAIGNQHGVYKAPPCINFEMLRQVRANVSVPLVLHGASGIGPEDIRGCIRDGITKVNIHTDLCQAGIASMQRDVAVPENILTVSGNKIQAVQDVAREKIQLFGSQGKA